MPRNSVLCLAVPILLSGGLLSYLLAILNEKKIVDENLCTMSFATFPNFSVYQKHAKNDQCRVRTGDLFGVNETR